MIHLHSDERSNDASDEDSGTDNDEGDDNTRCDMTPEVWDDPPCNDETDDLHHDSMFREINEMENDNKRGNDEEGKFLKVYVFFLLMLQTLFQLSDVALKTLLAFFAAYLTLIANTIKVPKLLHLSSKLPCSVKSARKLIHNTRDNFKKYVCCPTCHSLYNEECILNLNRTKESKRCPFIKFPSHPQYQH